VREKLHGGRRTFIIASLTRSDSMRPLRARLATRPSLDVPELRHAIPMLRVCVPPAERRMLLGNGSVIRPRRAAIGSLGGGGAQGGGRAGRCRLDAIRAKTADGPGQRVRTAYE
jgi:hypothetical protein